MTNALIHVLGCSPIEARDIGSSLAALKRFGFSVDKTGRQYRYAIRYRQTGSWILCTKSGHITSIVDGVVRNPPEAAEPMAWAALL